MIFVFICISETLPQYGLHSSLPFTKEEHPILSLLFSSSSYCINLVHILVFVITELWYDEYFLFLPVFRMSTACAYCPMPGEPSDIRPCLYRCGETPKSTLETLVQPSLIKACAFFCYRQVHLQTTIHHTSAPFSAAM